MKIINYKKTKSNLYEITLDNKEKVSLYDEIILKHELLLKKEIDLKQLNELINENSYYELYNKALKYLSSKMRSEKEIYQKFKEYPKDVIKRVVEQLKANNYLNNEEYIKAYVNDAVNLKMIGYYKIKNDLLSLGFEEQDITEYLDTIDADIWYGKIKKLTDNLVKNNKTYGVNKLKQKIVNTLVSKGFEREGVLSYLDEINISVDDKIYEKEYNKLKTKLERKYQGDTLEYEIRARLKAKGF